MGETAKRLVIAIEAVTGLSRGQFAKALAAGLQIQANNARIEAAHEEASPVVGDADAPRKAADQLDALAAGVEATLRYNTHELAEAARVAGGTLKVVACGVRPFGQSFLKKGKKYVVTVCGDESRFKPELPQRAGAYELFELDE